MSPIGYSMNEQSVEGAINSAINTVYNHHPQYFGQEANVHPSVQYPPPSAPSQEVPHVLPDESDKKFALPPLASVVPGSPARSLLQPVIPGPSSLQPVISAPSSLQPVISAPIRNQWMTKATRARASKYYHVH